ncbi:TetR/AcrR family transcriptional regulator [Amycolatopsis acidiphila]|uniref:TetR/AcrR family transcriptional regulator n=1 Tax=Amycolatopsis acidiphila TaxID=715473 RepID=A0A557ZWS2_9PSEU|nr:TetR/AcrR family transcriptional regulator [Amycolatopsis acidiphila]TVT16463.1 TetR/AcrR family transcriptional regulator [Amycolatopsis acidiphila]UIJ57903.1 TetR/AcrR family transcriptional regulator [Amycolatopsis acidiphila]GHG71227.1 TetR family transcriptional regulator [Amycolatopsis acidiphila]
MDVRTQMLEAAEKLLDASPDRDIATRAVCEAVGVGAPVLYRLFGDKNGLLSAVVDYGFDRYLAAKRAAEGSPDPVEDLRNGWDTHVAFALAHPAVYRLMYSPSFKAVPAAAQEALRLLREVLLRCAAAGKLRTTPDVAAQAIMSANIGVALNLVTQPEIYDDPGLSRRVRDAVFAGLLVEDDGSRTAEPGVAPAASQLAALLRAGQERPLGEPETALLLHWLDRLARQDA